MTGCIWVTLLYPLAEDEGITVYGPFADAEAALDLLKSSERQGQTFVLENPPQPDLEVTPGKVAKQQSDIVELPTELQHGVAKAVAAVMNLLLPTAEDHLQVIAMMLSAAHLSAMIISDDVDTGFYEALLERTGRVAHSVCLDMYGTHDLHSVAYRHDPQGAAYRARVSLDDLGPA